MPRDYQLIAGVCVILLVLTMVKLLTYIKQISITSSHIIGHGLPECTTASHGL